MLFSVFPVRDTFNLSGTEAIRIYTKVNPQAGVASVWLEGKRKVIQNLNEQVKQ